MEINEKKFGAKRKYRRGRVLKGPWVSEVVERGSQRVLLFPTKLESDMSIVLSLHISDLEPVIFSDRFTPYIPLNQLNHSKNFVDPDSGTDQCHQRCEGFGQEEFEMDVWYLV